MAINQNHLFEELNGVKCAIVEKNVTKERVNFLQRLLEYNKFSVMVVPSPPPKAPPLPAAKTAPSATQVTDLNTEALPPVVAAPVAFPETYTVGVTDVTFNPTNAIFGRLLKLPGRHVVTLAYWQQKEKESSDEVPYFEGKK